MYTLHSDEALGFINLGWLQCSRLANAMDVTIYVIYLDLYWHLSSYLVSFYPKKWLNKFSFG